MLNGGNGFCLEKEERDMLKALFLDFYGTLVEEDGPVIQDICRRIGETGGEAPPRSVARF